MTIKPMKGWTILKWDKPKDYKGEKGFFLPSGEEIDRHFKKQKYRELDTSKTPTDMMRWGKVVSSVKFKKGQKMLYSKYDVLKVNVDDLDWDAVRDEHLYALENRVTM